MNFVMPEVKIPVFADRNFNITDFGAIGDGIFLNTESINKAIDECSKAGGGKVTVPFGIWLTGPIELKSNVNLYLEDGAVLNFSKDIDLYPLIHSNYEGFPTIRATSPINANGAENIAITGSGVIEGNGDVWRPIKKWKVTEKQWKAITSSGGVITNPESSNALWFPSEEAAQGRDYDKEHGNKCTDLEECEKYKHFFRPVLVSIVDCKQVLLDGVTFQNSGAWCLHPRLCENLTIQNIKVRNPWCSANGDGLDIESCKYVKVYNSVFDVGDDAICIKSGKNEEGRLLGKPTEYVDIQKCTVYHGHGGFVVGSEMSGGARNILVKDCVFLGTDVGLRFKSCLGRGGVVENIYADNINMTNIANEAIVITTGYGIHNSKKGQQVEPEEVPEFKNINMKNINCIGAAKAIGIDGLVEMPIKNITVENAKITAKKGIDIKLTEASVMKNVTVINQNDTAQTVKIDNLSVNGEYCTEF